jgi:hypothetical protein
MMRLAIAGLLSIAVAAAAAPTCLGPLPYVKKADSPFDLSNVGVNFFFDDFESPTRAPGVTASTGSLIGFPQSIIDSVDEDDGVIDGSGLMGHSWFSGGGSTGVRWTFDAGVLGGLPTAAGIVWTDGGADGTVSFEAVAADGTTVLCATGPVSEPGVFPDNSNDGETAEDRFFGLYEPGGISSILLSNSSGGIEMDHIQFGLVGLATTSTTVASTSTTTTTLAGGCVVAPTYESILCRIDLLIADATSASDLGRLKQGILNAITKARKQAGRAAAPETKSKVAKNQLKKCAKSLESFRHKLDSNNAKKIIPQATRDDFRQRAADIKTDVVTLRGTL